MHSRRFSVGEIPHVFMVTRALKNGRLYRFVVNSVYDVLVAGGEGVKDVENDYGIVLDAGMKKGRIEVSGRTPIVRELFRFGPALFYIRGIFCRRLAIADLHDLDDGFPVLGSCQIAVDIAARTVGYHLSQNPLLLKRILAQWFLTRLFDRSPRR